MPLPERSSFIVNRSALFLSPHLDDVAFSCGGTLIRLVEEEWDVCLCTVFTASVTDPGGFALACQLDKGLSPEADYMALRRAEDQEFARRARVRRCLHLPYREAPHRGYNSAPDLFAGIHEGDEIWREIAVDLQGLSSFHEIFAPQGIGNHVDHLQTVLAVKHAGLEDRCTWYQDTPYAIRNPNAPASGLLPRGLFSWKSGIDLDRKVESCAAYTTQVPFQFGGETELRHRLESFHRSGQDYFETFLKRPGGIRSPGTAPGNLPARHAGRSS